MVGVERTVRRSRLSEVVAAELEAWLRAGGQGAGTQLPSEKALAERFGVSRPVIREAVSRLKADGWVETRQGAGAFLAPQIGRGSFRVIQGGAETADSLSNIFELRYLVETGAAELAARRRSTADLGRMESALERMDAVLSGAESGEAGGASDDDEFHVAIAAATGNPLIRRFVVFLGQQFSDSRLPTWDHAGRASGRARAAQDEHLRLYAAIKGGDPTGARQAASAHLLAAVERLGLETRDWGVDTEGGAS